jgi:hypothetical protein
MKQFNSIRIWTWVLIGSFLFVALNLMAQSDTKSVSLVGTWEKVSDKVGSTKTFTPVAKGSRFLKIYTPTHWVALAYDPATHEVKDSKGGTCSLSPEGMTEVVEFASNVAEWKSLFGQKFTYKVKIEGDTFIQAGQIGGTKFEETWRRAAVQKPTASTASIPSAKPVTFSGEAVCAKCILKQTEDCQIALRITTGGLPLAYFLEPNEVSKQLEARLSEKGINCCETPAPVTVTGTVRQVDGRPLITASRLDKTP